MKTVYLHIGFHKTGTSALQEYLSEHRDYLFENGILYPECFDTKYPGNVDLSWAFNKKPPKWSSVNDENQNEVFEFYAKQLDLTTCDSIVISSEDFVLLDNQIESIVKIKDFFQNYEVKIIAYIREPIDFIISLYSHAVRARAINVDLKMFIAEQFSFRSADYPARLHPWVKVFGKDNLIVNKYAPQEFVNNSLVEDFFDSIGLNIPLEIKMSKSNVGIHPWFIKAYIEVAFSDIDEDSKRKTLRQISKISQDLPKENASEYLLEQEDLKIIRNAYAVTQNKLKRDFGIEF